MKSLYLTAIFLMMRTTPTFASPYQCKPISGQIGKFSIDSTCAIRSSKLQHFSDVTFLYEMPNSPLPAICFYSEFSGKLGNIKISGTVKSGLTLNKVGVLTGASVIEVIDSSQIIEKRVGAVYTQDILFNPNTPSATEKLVMVSGQQKFENGRGNFEVIGDMFAPNAVFSGTICMKPIFP